MESRSAEGPPLEVRTTDDGSRTLFDRRAGQTYHSSHGAWTETRHVFLEGAGVAARLRPGATVHVVEVGLGTGANLLASWDAARASGARLHYRALERTPPPPASVAALGLDAHLAARSLLDGWLTILADLTRVPAPAWRAYRPAADLILEVAVGDAADGPDGAPDGPAARALMPDWADAIYHDAFSRDVSPALWSDAFLTACARALAPGGAWVSYSVAGEVRRRLRAAGLDATKRPGPPGGKREMTRAVRSL